MPDFHLFAAAAYFAAFVAATIGVARARQGPTRLAAAFLALGGVLHLVGLYGLHERETTPSLGEPAVVVSLIAWVSVVAFCGFLSRGRLASLAVLVAPVAFSAVAVTAAWLPELSAGAAGDHAGWSHVHVLLSAAGIAFLGIAGGAGALYVWRYRHLKQKRPQAGSALPSLEALDRVNLLALCLGFFLITLGVVTGFFWVRAASGSLWGGGVHAGATLGAWAIYIILMAGRFGTNLGARRSAEGAVAGFALLVLAWAGAGILG